MAGVGLGAIIVPQIARALIERVGWRGAYVGLGALTLAVAFPAVALSIREPNAREESGRAGAPLVRRLGVAAREAAGSAQFWLMAGVFLLAGAAINGPDQRGGGGYCEGRDRTGGGRDQVRRERPMDAAR